MKTLKLLFLITLIAACFACSSDDDNDMACSESTFFADTDADGLGDASNSQQACVAPTGFVANSDDNDDTQPLANLVTETFSNLFAPQIGGQGTGQDISGEFTRFDFETGEITTSDADWDIAFRGTTIAVNGGTETGTADEPARNGNAAVYIALGTFDEITNVDTTLLEQDAAEGFAITPASDQGWYNYSGFGNPDPTQDNLIRPLAGRILVFRTRDNRYAKVEILSYYQDAPANPNGFTDTPRYYTFNYQYQPNNNVTVF